MKFAAPLWLWALAALPLAYLGLRSVNRKRRKLFERFAAPAVWDKIAPELNWKARPRKDLCSLAALAFVILALARPQLGTHEETVKARGLDVMFVLDLSRSMDVEDVVPSRLKKAKHVIRTLLERLEGDRVGIVSFAASSYLSCPLTTDLGYVGESLEILGPEMIVNQGTDIGIALETARKALDRASEEGQTRPGQTPGAGASKVAILITDGEDHEGQGAAEAARLKEAGVRLYVFGVGADKGGPIPVRDGNGQLQGFKRDAMGNSVISAFELKTLEKVAEAAGGRYWTITADETETEELVKDMGSLQRTEFAERKFVVYEERYQIPLAIAALLLLLEWSLPARKLRVRIAPRLLRPEEWLKQRAANGNRVRPAGQSLV